MSREGHHDPLAVRVNTWAGADDIPEDGWPKTLNLETTRRILGYREEIEEERIVMSGEIKTIFVDHQPGYSFADVEPPIPFAPAEGEHQSVVDALYAAVLQGDVARTGNAENAQLAFTRELEGQTKEDAIEYIGRVFADLGYELKWVQD